MKVEDERQTKSKADENENNTIVKLVNVRKCLCIVMKIKHKAIKVYINCKKRTNGWTKKNEYRKKFIMVCIVLRKFNAFRIKQCRYLLISSALIQA